MKKRTYLFVIITLFFTSVSAQKFSIGASFFGPTYSYAGVFFESHFNEHFTAELGTDIRSIYAGVLIYPFRSDSKEDVATPYVGAILNHTNNILFELVDGMDRGLYGYFPVGISFFPERKFHVSIELSVNTDYVFEFGNFFGAIKFGYLIQDK